MTAGEPTAGVTAFIDILGFGGRVLSASEVTDVIAIRDAVRIIRNAFDHDPKDELTIRSQELYNTRVLAFSDSIIINTPLKSTATEYSGSFDPIMSEISSLALGQATCIENGIFLRGGVDLGWWYQEDDIIVSQSLTRAYYQEGKARYPVIAVTQDLYDYLSSHPDRNSYASSIDPLNSFEYIETENGRIHYLDYLSICCESVSWNPTPNERLVYKSASPEERDSMMNSGYRASLNAWLSMHRDKIQHAHSQCPEKDRPKYEWLSDYHNRISERYTTDQDVLCNLA